VGPSLVSCWGYCATAPAEHRVGLPLHSVGCVSCSLQEARRNRVRVLRAKSSAVLGRRRLVHLMHPTRNTGSSRKAPARRVRSGVARFGRRDRRRPTRPRRPCRIFHRVVLNHLFHRDRQIFCTIRSTISGDFGRMITANYLIIKTKDLWQLSGRCLTEVGVSCIELDGTILDGAYIPTQVLFALGFLCPLVV